MSHLAWYLFHTFLCLLSHIYCRDFYGFMLNLIYGIATLISFLGQLEVLEACCLGEQGVRRAAAFRRQFLPRKVRPNSSWFISMSEYSFTLMNLKAAAFDCQLQ